MNFRANQIALVKGVAIVLLISGVAAALGGLIAPVDPAQSPEPATSAAPASPQHAAGEGVAAPEALARLKQGNDRFAQHHPQHPDESAERLTSLASGQHPFAVVLCCSDSRVPPELVFDQGLGDLFVVRVAGNTLDDAVLGSIEYAVEHIGCALVVVMGHEKCGAVTAALSDHQEQGHIPSIAKPIQAVAAEARSMGGDAVHNAVALNARRVAGELRASEPLLKKHATDGTMQVVSAVYDVATGRAAFDQGDGAAKP